MLPPPLSHSMRKKKDMSMHPFPRSLPGSGVVMGLLMLGACSLSPRVESDALAYHEAADVTANRIILLNVLRAKDNAPLHFAELSLLHGSVSESGTVVETQPIGQIPHSSALPRATVAPSATVGDQVTFDLGTLDTQTFTQGVTAPISPRMLKYFLDSGVDHRLVLLLLLSSARPAGGEEAIANYPRSERVVCYLNGRPKPGDLPSLYQVHGMETTADQCPGREREFLAFLRILNGLPRVFAVSSKPFVPVGPPFRPNNANLLHDMLSMDHNKQTLTKLPGGLMQLGVRSDEDEIVLCQDRPASGAAARLKVTMGDPCNPGATSEPMGAKVSRDEALLDFTVRSTLGIFSFLGQVLGGEERRSEKAGTDICITLDDRGSQHDCASGQVLFHLTHDRTHARFGVDYGGEFWGVPEARPCLNPTEACDHTLETLSMVSLLLNLSKSARDIPSTPAVQLVP
jgi:hypothetical protein